MINHARTLLLNLAPGDMGRPAEEYIPDNFVPTTPPDYAQKIRRVLFGVNPTAAARLRRTRQYLALLHATELEEFVLALDPRITYDPTNANAWEDAADTATPASELGAIATILTSIGEEPINELFGIGTLRPTQAPFKTFWNLWKTHYALPYRLGGLLLALIYRADEQLTG